MLSTTASHQDFPNIVLMERVYNEPDDQHAPYIVASSSSSSSSSSTATASHPCNPTLCYSNHPSDEETSSSTTTSSTCTPPPARAAPSRRPITVDAILWELWMANDEHALTLPQFMQMFDLHHSAQRRYQFRQVVADLTYIRNYPVFSLVLKKKHYPIQPEEEELLSATGR